MLAGVTDCRRSQKWGCKGRWALGFKPRPSSHRVEETTRLQSKWGGDHAALKESREDHEVLGCFFLSCSLGSRRDFARKKGERGLLLVGHEKVPHGFGLTGDRSSHTADGAGSLNHKLLLLFLRHGTPDWAQGEGRTVHLWVF